MYTTLNISVRVRVVGKYPNKGLIAKPLLNPLISEDFNTN
jgi:hypothetical protein